MAHQERGVNSTAVDATESVTRVLRLGPGAACWGWSLLEGLLDKRIAALIPRWPDGVKSKIPMLFLLQQCDLYSSAREQGREEAKHQAVTKSTSAKVRHLIVEGSRRGFPQNGLVPCDLLGGLSESLRRRSCGHGMWAHRKQKMLDRGRKTATLGTR